MPDNNFNTVNLMRTKLLVLFFLATSALSFGQGAKAVIDNANALCEVKQFIEAFVLLQNGAIDHPNSDSLYYYMGLIKTDYLMEHAEALGYFKRAVELNPNSAYGYFGMGKSNLELENFDEAVKDLASALKIKPDMFEAAYNLAYAYYRWGWQEPRYFKKSLPYFAKAIKIREDFTDSYLLRGIAQYRMGDFKQASQDFPLFEAMSDPDAIDTSFLYYAAFPEYYLSNFDRALELFNQYCALDSLDADIFLLQRVL